MSISTVVQDVKLVAIGNSRGVRLPRELLRKYGIGSTLVLEERPDGILLRSSTNARLSLDQTFAEMAVANEDWSGLEIASADGLASLKW